MRARRFFEKSKFFEYFLSFLGIVVTGILGYGQIQIGREQARQAAMQEKDAKAEAARQDALAEKRQADLIEIQVMQMVAGHLENLARKDEKFESSQKVVVAASAYLTRKYDRRALSEMAREISEVNPSLTLNLLTSIKENTGRVSPQAPWFAVLMSLPASDKRSAERAANKISKALQPLRLKYGVQIYKTKISNNFALVLGGPLKREDAASVVLIAKKNMIAADAFSQQDRGWTFIGTAPFQID